MKEYNTLLFDIDGTLLDFKKAEDYALHKTFIDHQLELTDEIFEIYEIINKLAEQGVAVIIVSSEMTEIIGICDRTMIMAQGRVTGELGKEELNEAAIIKMAMKEG